MSRALFEEVTWDDEKVTSVDWRTYRTFPVGFKIPRLETVLINTLEAEACGAGETSNHRHGSGDRQRHLRRHRVRLRQVPFSPERIKQAALTHGAEAGRPLRDPKGRHYDATICDNSHDLPVIPSGSFHISSLAT
jgi:hypothetical protein